MFSLFFPSNEKASGGKAVFTQCPWFCRYSFQNQEENGSKGYLPFVAKRILILLGYGDVLWQLVCHHPNMSMKLNWTPFGGHHARADSCSLSAFEEGPYLKTEKKEK